MLGGMSKILQFPQSRATAAREPAQAGQPDPQMSLLDRIASDGAVLEQLMHRITATQMPTNTRAELLARAAELANTAAQLHERMQNQPMPTAAPGPAADLSRLEGAMEDLIGQYNALLPNAPSAVPTPKIALGRLSGTGGGDPGFGWLLVTAGALAIGTAAFMLVRRHS
jgi:hypothetical protein